MAEEFKYISPREFQKLSAAEKKRYLTALFENARGGYKPPEKSSRAAPASKRRLQKAPKP